ncbi:MAG: hypothetical protein HQK99_06085 [Nitrospirae bacterium]|nr:hypothetical protein [Nitrospirota bacterium]
MLFIEDIKSEYENKSCLYGEFLEEVTNQLKDILCRNEMQKISEITSRIKDFASITHNINNYKYKPTIPAKLCDITDLAGIRITLLFKRNIEAICKLIETYYEVKRKKYIFQSEQQFGYESLHYEVKIKRECCTFDKYDKFNNLIVEIQVRTLAQHLWAAASHYLNYKERKDVALPFQRPMGRISALLDMVDDEYDRLLNLKEKYQKEIEISDSKEMLNVDLLKRILDEEFPADKGFRLGNPDDPNVILENLFLFNISTVKEFRALLNKQKTNALKYQESGFRMMRMIEPRKIELDAKGLITFSIYGIIEKMLALEFGKENGFDFFEKINRIPAGTMEKLISSMEIKEQEDKNDKG